MHSCFGSLMYGVTGSCRLPTNDINISGFETSLAPIPAYKQDFQRMKLTSFDKLIEQTCSLVKNVRFSTEPDLRPNGGAGNLGVAPDAA